MEDKNMLEMIKIMASCKEVIDAVNRSHDDNPWWPISIYDWRKRMIVGGLGTRVSFRMISTYIRTINEFDSFSYDEIKMKSDAEIVKILKPLGLTETRINFLRSMSKYVDANSPNEEFFQLQNDEIIADIAEKVNGASYKVGQCCALYAKGYYCGIIPVDSGIKDVLAPCLGLKTAKKEIGHEIVRHQFEDLAKRLDLKNIAELIGYDKNVTLPENKPLTWWFHLVLINFKRHYCNNRKPEVCPLAESFFLQEMCRKR